MQERRIGEEPQAQQPARMPTTAGFTRVGTVLASPLGVLITVPGLVVLVGLFYTLAGQMALRSAMLSMAEERFRQRTEHVSGNLEEALLHADVVLERLDDYAHAGGAKFDFKPLALVLRDLTLGRPGMTQAYIGYPSGEYYGVYEEQNRLLFQHSWVESGGRTVIEHFRYRGDELVPLRREDSDYDPRKRVWYQLALEKDQRVWTDTYPFFTTGHTGVTRAEPLHAGGKGSPVLAVAGIDFDVSALSHVLARTESPSSHSLIYASDGSILAYPLAAERIEHFEPDSRALNYRDLRDSLLDSYFAALSGNHQNSVLRSFDWNGEPVVTVSAPVSVQGLPWTVAVLAKEKTVLAPLPIHQRRSLMLGGAALIVALVVSWLFARTIVRQRRQVAQARQEAALAERRATELGSYRLVSLLGKGGMGEVWRAQHQLLAREAAIKLINSDLQAGQGSGEIVERFRREAQTIAALRSRNTVALFDYGVTKDGTFFYVMEMLDGIDLETLVDRFGPQPAERVINILVQACNSLGEAHDAGLVHRDVKPANLFLCRAADEVDLVKVLDFGLVMARNGQPLASPSSLAWVDPAAEALTSPAASATGQSGPSPGGPAGSQPSLPSLPGDDGRLTRAGDYLGTPAFIAPEQALGHP
ncbi:MAG TPA: protein kinase, partial [Polyangiaceae bacterium]|nr:protein kinase [Polyangiaceae bacterium]